MKLQLLSLLDASSDKHIAIEIMVFVEKKPPKLSGRLRRKPCIPLVKKPLKLNKKMRKKNRKLD